LCEAFDVRLNGKVLGQLQRKKLVVPCTYKTWRSASRTSWNQVYN